MSEKYEMSGTVKEIMDEATFGTLTKREFVVTSDEEKYPQDIKFECINDKVALVDSLTVGQKVKVSFNLRGNNKNSTGRYFVNVTAWKVEAGAQSAAPVSADGGSLDEESSETLPF